MNFIDFNTFQNVDIRVGEIIKAETYPEARKPALKLWINFGKHIGEKKSSAQITDHYKPNDLIGKKILAVINLKPRQIGKFISEVLVLGVPASWVKWSREVVGVGSWWRRWRRVNML